MIQNTTALRPPLPAVRQVAIRRTPSAVRTSLLRTGLLLATAIHVGSSPGAAQNVPPPAAQNPSPMVEHTRQHERLEKQALAGVRRSFAGPLDKPVDVFIPESSRGSEALRLVIHFHGASFIPEEAVARLASDHHVVATVHLGPGSGIYDRSFSEPESYASIVNGVRQQVGDALGREAGFERVTLSGFSAGYGAIRAILRVPEQFDRIDGVLLLDGLHTDYVPERTVLAEGGRLDEGKLDVFVRFARAAARSEKRLVITHSEIFPGTFASTTETTDFVLQALGLRRVPVLRWGPRGMQQLSEVQAGRLRVLGFAGNTAPDHVDHFHAMPEFLRLVEDL